MLHCCHAIGFYECRTHQRGLLCEQVGSQMSAPSRLYYFATRRRRCRRRHARGTSWLYRRHGQIVDGGLSAACAFLFDTYRDARHERAKQEALRGQLHLHAIFSCEWPQSMSMRRAWPKYLGRRRRLLCRWPTMRDARPFQPRRPGAPRASAGRALAPSPSSESISHGLRDDVSPPTGPLVIGSCACDGLGRRRPSCSLPLDLRAGASDFDARFAQRHRAGFYARASPASMRYSHASRAAAPPRAARKMPPCRISTLPGR